LTCTRVAAVLFVGKVGIPAIELHEATPVCMLPAIGRGTTVPALKTIRMPTLESALLGYAAM
jgi:hypothetical protein